MSFISDPATGGQLNYFTLHIRDDVIRKQLEDALIGKWDSIYYIALVFATSFLLLNLSLFLMKTSQFEVQMFLECFLFGFNFALWTILKFLKQMRHTSKVITTLYLLEMVIFVNFSYNKIMPAGIALDLTNLQFFQG